MNYQEFILSKKITSKSYGITVDNIHSQLFDFQKDLVRWALKKGRAALFTMTGTGKTLMQCEWGRHVAEHTKGKVLILAPLAVSKQTVREAQKIDLQVNPCRSQAEVKPGVNITNYEILHKFNAEEFDGIVLDESSILKSFTGKIRTQIIDSFQNTPFRLACTATPAPNDFMELGNHSEFLGVMTRTEMLSMFFVHDGGETQKWRLKGHAKDKFWEWVASWASVLSKPSDLGYSDEGFILPPLRVHEHIVEARHKPSDRLFVVEAETLQERQRARKDSTEDRVKKAAEIVNNIEGPTLVWCGLNYESELLKKAIDNAVEVKGSDSNEHKENSMLGFADGEIKALVSKSSICGFGMNFQVCSDMVFVGLSDSFEQYFQAVRRAWRFGQTKPVNVHIIISEAEGAVKANIERKERDAQVLLDEMVQHTKEIVKNNIKKTERETEEYKANLRMKIPAWLRSDDVAS